MSLTETGGLIKLCVKKRVRAGFLIYPNSQTLGNFATGIKDTYLSALVPGRSMHDLLISLYIPPHPTVLTADPRINALRLPL